MGVGAPSSVDMIEVLSEWVEKGKAPGDLVQLRQETAAPFAALAARPMCRYPAYPHYAGGEPRRRRASRANCHSFRTTRFARRPVSNSRRCERCHTAAHGIRLKTGGPCINHSFINLQAAVDNC
jgi:hypothetical protein